MAIVAIDSDDRVALVRQWRLPADAALLEIPAGGLDVAADGTKEDPAVAARRELEEETGMRARTWRKLAEFYSAPGFTDELMHLYLATDLEPAASDGRLGPDEDERLILEWRPWTETVAAVERGEIRDAKSIVGVLWLERHRQDSGAAPSAATPDPAGGTLAADVMRVTYRLSVGEAVRAIVGVSRRSIGIRLLGLVTLLISVFAALSGDLLSIVGVVIGLAMISGWVIAPFVWWQFRQRPDLVGADTTLILDDSGVEIEDPVSPGRTAWTTYQKVNDVGGYLVFDSEGGTSMIVPKRAFSASQLASLYRLLDRHGLAPGAKG